MKVRYTCVLGTLLVVSSVPTEGFAAGLADDSVLSQHVKEADGTSGQNTNTGSGIKTAHIQDGAVTGSKVADGAIAGSKIAPGAVSTSTIADGAVTDAKITGPISAAKISSADLDADTVDGYHASDLAKKSANVIVVSKDGRGDFTDPVAAMASITGASESNPYLLKIEPGVYDIGVNTLLGKPWVDVQGAGENTTVVTGAGAAGGNPWTNCVAVFSDHEEARFITFKAYGANDLAAAVCLEGDGSAPSRLLHVTASATLGSTASTYSNAWAVVVHLTGAGDLQTGVVELRHVTATASSPGAAFAVYNTYGTTSLQVIDSTVRAEGGVTNIGVVAFNGNAILRSNVSTGPGAQNSQAVIVNYMWLNPYPPRSVIAQSAISIDPPVSGSTAFAIQASVPLTVAYSQVSGGLAFHLGGPYNFSCIGNYAADAQPYSCEGATWVP